MVSEHQKSKCGNMKNDKKLFWDMSCTKSNRGEHRIFLKNSEIDTNKEQIVQKDMRNMDNSIMSESCARWKTSWLEGKKKKRQK